MALVNNDKKVFLGQHKCFNVDLGAEFFYLTYAGQLRMNNYCAAVNLDLNPTSDLDVHMEYCKDNSNNQQWKFTDDGELFHLSTGKCLDAFPGMMVHNDTARLSDCVKESEEEKKFQFWSFDEEHNYHL